MAKDSYWFKHDSNARDDIKLVRLRKIYTHWSDGIYWNVIEVLREQKKYKYPLNESDLQLLCEDLIRCKDFEKFKNWLNDSFNLTPESLFKKDENFFWSESLIKRMKNWEVLKKNGEKGGRPKSYQGEGEEPKPKPDIKPKEEPKPKPDGKPLDKNRKDKIIEEDIRVKKVFSFSEQYLDKEYMTKEWQYSIVDLLTIDGYSADDIMDAIRFARTDDFWKLNFMSPLKLRRKDKDKVKYIDKFLVRARDEKDKQQKLKKENSYPKPRSVDDILKRDGRL